MNHKKRILSARSILGACAAVLIVAMVGCGEADPIEPGVDQNVLHPIRRLPDFSSNPEQLKKLFDQGSVPSDEELAKFKGIKIELAEDDEEIEMEVDGDSATVSLIVNGNDVTWTVVKGDKDWLLSEAPLK